MKKVAVVDDDADLGQILCESFTCLGADDCRSYSSMRDLVADASYAVDSDLIVLDVNLGDGVPSGIDAYNWLRAKKFDGTVVFLTGHARSHPLVTQAVKQNSAKLYEKPIGIEQLAQLL